jgi:hypothetical protein
MCLDDSHEVAAALPTPVPSPVVITETDGIRVEFYGVSWEQDAMVLLINECIKHGKPINHFEQLVRHDDGGIQIPSWVAWWA